MICQVFIYQSSTIFYLKYISNNITQPIAQGIDMVLCLVLYNTHTHITLNPFHGNMLEVTIHLLGIE
jgi:hypothetical protein